MSMAAPVRFACVVGCLGFVWGLVLPWLGRWAVIARHVAAMEARDVNPAAMVYTELERLPVRPRWVETRVILWP